MRVRRLHAARTWRYQIPAAVVDSGLLSAGGVGGVDGLGEGFDTSQNRLEGPQVAGELGQQGL
jgi:hypothetical protein